MLTDTTTARQNSAEQGTSNNDKAGRAIWQQSLCYVAYVPHREPSGETVTVLR